MSLKLGLAFVGCALAAFAQTPGERELTRAQSAVEELRKQVEAGAAPRAKLDQSEEALVDAQDAVLLSHTLYGTDLTEEQSQAMEAAALRRFERRKAQVEKVKELVEAGGAPRLSLTAPLEEMDWARREYDMTVSRSHLVHEIAEMARAEQQALESQSTEVVRDFPVSERFDGDGSFTTQDFKNVVLAYQGQFARALPVSARGETAVHRALGFDHRNRVDVALHPDSREGVWLREYLEASDIPYFAFRASVPGKATAAHVHLGPPSNRLIRTD